MEFYRGREEIVAKLVVLCEIYTLPVEVIRTSDGTFILQGPKDKMVTFNKILLAIGPYMAGYESNSSKFAIKDFFMPKKSITSSIEQADSIFNRIDNSRYVLHAERIASLEIGNKDSIKLFYVANPFIESQIELLLTEIKKNNLNQVIVKSAVDLDPEISRVAVSSESSLSVFEPFSFQVLNSERNLAGMQFLLLLLLFLLSGFILGLWWRRKA